MKVNFSLSTTLHRRDGTSVPWPMTAGNMHESEALDDDLHLNTNFSKEDMRKGGGEESNRKGTRFSSRSGLWEVRAIILDTD